MATITAGDYTLEFDIKEKTYVDWYVNNYDREGGDRA